MTDPVTLINQRAAENYKRMTLKKYNTAEISQLEAVRDRLKWGVCPIYKHDILQAMIITEQERRDIVAVFNAQDAAKKLRSKDIKIFNTVITCYETGMVERAHKRWGHRIATFGTKQGNGYLQLSVDGHQVRVHRLIAMAFIEGFDESMEVDHIDGDKQNNALENLRQVTSSENKRAFRRKSDGCSSKYRGVSKDKRYNVWYAKLKISGGTKYVGCFKSEEDAARAWNKEALSFGFTEQALNQL